MKAFPFSGVLSLVAASAAFGGVSTQRTPVELRLVGDDALSQKFQVALEKGLRKSSHFRPAVEGEQGAITVESDRNVAWDKLSGRTVVIYSVTVRRKPEVRIQSTGVCWANAMAKCAQEILVLAQKQLR